MSDTVSRPAFVRTSTTPAMPAPALARGLIGWVRENLFANGLSVVLTLLSLALVAWILPGLVRYLFIDAIWTGADGAVCRAPGAGACWAYVARKLDYFRYGSYPEEARWRADGVLLWGAVLATRLLWQSRNRGGLASLIFVAGVPLVAFVLAPGLTRLATSPGLDHLMLALAVALAAGIWFGNVSSSLVALLFFVVYPVLSFIFLHGAASLGLTVIDTNLWGGLFVSLIVSVVGIVFSLPIGILLALGRRSKLPIVKFVCVVFIEFVRGVPLITVLFMANTMLPLFVPPYLTPDRLMRPLIGVALFAAAYMAEVVRAGLQAMPKGQFEGAMSLGLSYWRMMGLIILPQALVTVIPGIVNSFISLFKDTTLVAIVGIFDFLRTVDTARLDPEWAGPTISTTGYIFAALFYWAFCFGMSRYSQMMERKLNVGRKR